MCQTCPSQRETVHHFLMTCPAYTDARRHLETNIGRAARLMKTLLSNPKTFPHLFRYISATRRFNHKGSNLNLPAQQDSPAARATLLAPTLDQLRLHSTRSA